MKKVFLSLAVIAALTVVSCKQTEAAPADAAATTEAPVEAAPVVDSAAAVTTDAAAAATTEAAGAVKDAAAKTVDAAADAAKAAVKK